MTFLLMTYKHVQHTSQKYETCTLNVFICIFYPKRLCCVKWQTYPYLEILPILFKEDYKTAPLPFVKYQQTIDEVSLACGQFPLSRFQLLWLRANKTILNGIIIEYFKLALYTYHYFTHVMDRLIAQSFEITSNESWSCFARHPEVIRVTSTRSNWRHKTQFLGKIIAVCNVYV